MEGGGCIEVSPFAAEVCTPPPFFFPFYYRIKVRFSGLIKADLFTHQLKLIDVLTHTFSHVLFFYGYECVSNDSGQTRISDLALE